MYLDHFGLTTKPFQITTDSKFLWLGEKHKEALATLRYGIQDNRGFLLLTGEVGTGKTILVNRLISLLDSDTIAASLPDSDLDEMDFYKLLAYSLKINQPFSSKGEFLIHFREFLHQSYANHKQVLLIIDESQRLNHRLLEDIRVLSNIELQDRKLINIFFVGQPEFNRILNTPENRAMSQRITIRYHIEALEQQETYDYVTYRLRVAGSKKPIFKITALNEIFLFTGGIPRLINILCDHSLLTAFCRNLNQVDSHVIRECADELRIPVEQTQSDVATIRMKEEALSNSEPAAATGSNASAPDRKEAPTTPLERGEVKGWSGIPVLWPLSFFVAILILLVALGITINLYTRGKESRYGDADLTTQKSRTTPGSENARLSDRLRVTKKNQVDQHPTVMKPMDGMRMEKAATDGMKAESHRKLDEVPSVSSSVSGNSTNAFGNSSRSTITGGFTKSEAPTGIEAATSAETQIETLPLMNEKVVIQFNINSNEIEAGAYASLNRVAHHLKEHPEQRIIIRGYTDLSGSDSYNETVSNFRANAVKFYLLGKGVKAANMTLYAMGATDPITSNETSAGRKRNRRVEIEFVKS